MKNRELHLDIHCICEKKNLPKSSETLADTFEVGSADCCGCCVAGLLGELLGEMSAGNCEISLSSVFLGITEIP